MSLKTPMPDDCPDPSRECPAQNLGAEIAALSASLTIHANTLEGMVGRIEGFIEKADRTLYGNGQLGLLTRMDRIEQSELRREKVQGTMRNIAVGVVVGLGIQTVLILVSIIYAVMNHLGRPQ